MITGKEYIFWHGTSTGADNETLDSLRSRGGLVKEFSSAVCQRSGVFLSQNKAFCEGHARGAVALGDLSGSPLLIEVALKAENIGSEWDFDYEFQFETVCEFLKSFRGELKVVMPLGDTTIIHNQWFGSVEEEFKLASLTISENRVEAVIDDLLNKKSKSKIVSGRGNFDHDRRLRAAFETVCHKLSSLYPEKYNQHFKETIETLADEEKTWGIKYTGTAPVPVRSITIL